MKTPNTKPIKPPAVPSNITPITKPITAYSKNVKTIINPFIANDLIANGAGAEMLLSEFFTISR